MLGWLAMLASAACFVTAGVDWSAAHHLTRDGRVIARDPERQWLGEDRLTEWGRRAHTRASVLAVAGSLLMIFGATEIVEG